MISVVCLFVKHVVSLKIEETLIAIKLKPIFTNFEEVITNEANNLLNHEYAVTEVTLRGYTKNEGSKRAKS